MHRNIFVLPILPAFLLLLLAACEGTPPAVASPAPAVPAHMQLADPVTPEAVDIRGEIGAGSTYATPWRERRGVAQGPSIIVEAGIHGDEIAGILAVDDLAARLDVLSGAVVFLPRMNKPAVDAGERSINRDLNHAFPGDPAGLDYESRLAAELMAWVGERDADAVITLHESRYLHDGKNPKTFGQTVVYGVTPMPEILPRVLDRANAKANDERERFRSNYYPITTSSTEQFVARYGMLGLCLETWRGHPIATRIRRHQDFVLALLDELGIGYRMEPPDSTVVSNP